MASAALLLALRPPYFVTSLFRCVLNKQKETTLLLVCLESRSYDSFACGRHIQAAPAALAWQDLLDVVAFQDLVEYIDFLHLFLILPSHHINCYDLSRWHYEHMHS